jgi:hypothetical protein
VGIDCSVCRAGRLPVGNSVLGALLGRQVAREEAAHMVDSVVIIGVPEPGCLVAASRKDVLAVGRERHPMYHVAMARQTNEHHSR